MRSYAYLFRIQEINACEFPTMMLQNENPHLMPIYWLSNQYINLEQMYYQRIHIKHEESLTSDVLPKMYFI